MGLGNYTGRNEKMEKGGINKISNLLKSNILALEESPQET